MAVNETDVSRPDAPCPCGSEKPYRACCRPLHQGAAAATPRALMRSRYAAFVLGLADYLRQTWHRSTRPARLDLANAPQWSGLEVLGSTEQDETGQVHFRAIHRMGDGWGYLEEKSDFVREAGRWYYLAGDTREGTLRPGRNDRCPCGSGRKFKACCR